MSLSQCAPNGVMEWQFSQNKTAAATVDIIDCCSYADNYHQLVEYLFRAAAIEQAALSRHLIVVLLIN